MITKKAIITSFALITLNCSCQKELIEYKSGDIKISLESGTEWKHPFDLFLGIKKQNRPQIAIWMEDTAGNYLTTLYVTYKAGTKSWSGNNGDPRKEALPHWNYARLPFQPNQPIPDGYTGATTQKPIADAVTGATPLDNFNMKITPNSDKQQFVIKAEINHSTDYNDFYPKNAIKGDENYSAESGQPAVVYQTIIDLTTDKKEYTAQLIGHSSPDGSNGQLYTDLSKLTTAKNIIKEIKISIE